MQPVISWRINDMLTLAKVLKRHESADPVPNVMKSIDAMNHRHNKQEIYFTRIDNEKEKISRFHSSTFNSLIHKCIENVSRFFIIISYIYKTGQHLFRPVDSI